MTRFKGIVLLLNIPGILDLHDMKKYVASDRFKRVLSARLPLTMNAFCMLIFVKPLLKPHCTDDSLGQ